MRLENCDTGYFEYCGVVFMIAAGIVATAVVAIVAVIVSPLYLIGAVSEWLYRRCGYQSSVGRFHLLQSFGDLARDDARRDFWL